MIFDKSKKVDLLFFVLITLAVGVTSLVLGKDTNWDLRNYHFYNGYAFLTDRLNYDIAPAQVQTYLNPLFDVFIYLGIKFLPAKVFGFVLGAIQGIGIWLVYQLSRVVTKEYPEKSSILLSVLAAVTAFSGAGWFSEIGNTMGDSIIAIFVLSALLLTILHPSPITLNHGKRMLIGAGFLVGFGTGLKLVAAVYFLGLLFPMAFIMSKRQIVTQYAIFSASFVGGMAASIGFWMVKLWDNFQNPLFPFYNAIFKSPYFEFINFADRRFLPRTLVQKLCYPFFFAHDSKLVCELSFRDFRLPILYIILVLFLSWSLIRFILFREKLSNDQNNDRIAYFLASFSAISYLIWQIMFSAYRYLIPLELLTPVVVIAVLCKVIRNSWLSYWLSSSIFFFLIITTIPMSWGRRPWGHRYLSLSASAPLSKFDNSTILMSGGQPISYVIPFFPETTKFVRVRCNFFRPGNSNKMQPKIDEAIHESKHLRMLLSESFEIAAVKANNVNVDLNSCDSISTSIGDELLLCDASIKK